MFIVVWHEIEAKREYICFSDSLKLQCLYFITSQFYIKSGLFQEIQKLEIAVRIMPTSPISGQLITALPFSRISVLSFSVHDLPQTAKHFSCQSQID